MSPRRAPSAARPTPKPTALAPAWPCADGAPFPAQDMLRRAARDCAGEIYGAEPNDGDFAIFALSYRLRPCGMSVVTLPPLAPQRSRSDRGAESRGLCGRRSRRFAGAPSARQSMPRLLTHRGHAITNAGKNHHRKITNGRSTTQNNRPTINPKIDHAFQPNSQRFPTQ